MNELIVIDTQKLQMARYENGEETIRVSFEWPLNKDDVETLRTNPDRFVQENAS